MNISCTQAKNLYFGGIFQADIYTITIYKEITYWSWLALGKASISLATPELLSTAVLSSCMASESTIRFSPFG